MSIVRFRHRGDLKKTENFLNSMKNADYFDALDTYAQLGVKALAENTPKDSGLTASSWGYEIKRSKGSVRISWINTNVNQNVNIAVILQYGHGTGTGGYVEGRDYINPAMRPVFDEIAEGVWKEVTSS